jgi:hypothetical protein
LSWARSAIAQCKGAGVPVFVKQLGSNAINPSVAGHHERIQTIDRAGTDPAEWPEDLRVQEFPDALTFATHSPTKEA